MEPKKQNLNDDSILTHSTQDKEVQRLKNVLSILPEEISVQLENADFELDSIGQSHSKVYLFDNDTVLKIENKSEESDSEYQMLKWLQAKLPVLEVKGFFTDGEKNYLLMSRLRGTMSCDKAILENGRNLVQLLANGLKRLWEVDTADCPSSVLLEEKLKQALKRVKCNQVDVLNAEPDTFGENGFKDPADLYSYLLENQPEEERSFVHGDYCLPNVFIENNTVSGYLDLGRSGVGDKWQDIVLAVRSLKHNLEDYGKEDLYPSLYSLFFAELGLQPDEEKIRYYILLDELF